MITFRILAFATVLFVSCPAVRADEDFGIEFPVVESIVILGNRSFDDDALKSRMHTGERRFYHFIKKPRYRRDFLRRDLEAIRSFYNRNGFFAASVTIDSIDHDEKSNTVRIRILVNEGPQTVVRSLTFGEQALVPERELRAGLRLVEGAPYNPNLLDVDRYTLYRKFFERGHLGAVVTYEATVDSLEVDIAWSLDPRIPVKIDTIEVTGNTTVRERLVRRELKVRPGEYFRLARVLESSQNLYDTGYFSSVEIVPVGLDIGQGSTDLEIQVRERKKGYIETGFGVGNVHGNRVFAEWGQRNLFGRGYALNLHGEYAFSLFRDNTYRSENWEPKNRYFLYRGTLLFPHVLGTWNSFTVGADHEYDATVEPAIIRGSNFNLSLSRRFTRQTTIVFGYALESIERENVPEEPPSSRRRALDFAYRRDTRDYYFNPTRGMFLTVETRCAGGPLGGDDDYYSVIPTFQEYRSAARGSIVAYRFRFGYAEPFGDSVERGIPIESRFFAGGSNSVRGYSENSLGPRGAEGDPRGGRVLLLGNVELRFPIPWIGRYNFGAVVFADGGNVWNSLDEVTWERFRIYTGPADTGLLDFRFSIGYGLRYYTPVGPIRIDVGYPLNRMTGEDAYRVHISLGQIF
ncbi:MAG: outer membrane protein assembly factor BamA [Candidatus Krumholzibacteria bacterium]|nr:outer membrane protein assembly factor BamA [Candidatus Krumholzibacteria bacterium]